MYDHFNKATRVPSSDRRCRTSTRYARKTKGFKKVSEILYKYYRDQCKAFASTKTCFKCLHILEELAAEKGTNAKMLNKEKLD